MVLSPDQQTLYDLAFHSLRPRDFLSLALVGEWCNAQSGERLLTAGDPAAGICIATSGANEMSG